MSIVAPALTAATVDEFRVAIERLKGFATRVHIDLSDGQFAPSFLIPIGQVYWPANWQVDIHAMVTQPSLQLAEYIKLRPYSIILHAEAGEDILPLLNQIKEAGIQAGVGLLKSTVPSIVAPLIQAADHVMIFSGDLGHYGGVASLMQLEKIRLIKNINPNVEIGWDGGVNASNAYTLTQGGVDVLNVGGALANAQDPAGMYDTLVKETQKRGII